MHAIHKDGLASPKRQWLRGFVSARPQAPRNQLRLAGLDATRSFGHLDNDLDFSHITRWSSAGIRRSARGISRSTGSISPPSFHASLWQDTRREYGEARFNMLAVLGSRVLHITFTVRGEVTWLISVRKAKPKEQRNYA
jgi:uncharacterized protein